MKCVVTGAAGFIGSHLCQALLHSGHEVVGLDSFAPYYPPLIKQRNLLSFLSLPNCRFFRIDLGKDRFDDMLTGADVIFHLAALSGTARGRGDMDEHWAANVQVTQKLLEATRRAAHGLRRFVFASTSSVYGKDASGDETMPARPICPEGITKLAAENLCLACADADGVPAVILRYSSVYGPRQPPDMDHHRFIQALLQDQPVVVYGDGQQVCGDVYVEDCVRATLAAIDASPGDVFNVAGRESASVKDVLGKLEALTGRKARVRHEPARAGDPGQAVADTTRLRTRLGWTPRTGLDEGLAQQWAWQAGEMKHADEPLDRVAERRAHDARRLIVSKP
jgi:nucleoside-diphosphate-sugar epimerase